MPILKATAYHNWTFLRKINIFYLRIKLVFFKCLVFYFLNLLLVWWWQKCFEIVSHHPWHTLCTSQHWMIFLPLEFSLCFRFYSFIGRIYFTFLLSFSTLPQSTIMSYFCVFIISYVCTSLPFFICPSESVFIIFCFYVCPYLFVFLHLLYTPSF